MIDGRGLFASGVVAVSEKKDLPQLIIRSHLNSIICMIINIDFGGGIQYSPSIRVKIRLDVIRYQLMVTGFSNFDIRH